MDISLFADIKPTWETVAFDEGIDRIPSSSKKYNLNYQNPLDKKGVVCFSLDYRRFLCYTPVNDTCAIVENIYDLEMLSEVLHCRVSYLYCAPDNVRSIIRYFLYAMVIGESLVFRKFSLKITYARIDDDTYKCTSFPVREVCRYVYGEYGLILEKPDKSYAFLAPDKLPSDDSYDILADAGHREIYGLYTDIVKRVKLRHKEDILRTLRGMEGSLHRLGFELFKSLYAKADEHYDSEGDIPETIRRELDMRKHRPNKAVRLDKDLMAVSAIRRNKPPERDEEIRIYFDSKRTYCFAKNPVTDEWHAEDIYKAVLSKRQMREMTVDKDLFDGTCMEKHTGLAAKICEAHSNRLGLGILMAISRFLCAEQAAKAHTDLFDVILENIYDGRIVDEERSLPEVFGITGRQIKYLDRDIVPNDLQLFCECMRSDDFIEHFPDVKKRIFAVSFFLDRRLRWDREDELTGEEIFEAAQTLNSIERADSDKRRRMMDEYRDYLLMHEDYLGFLAETDQSIPLAREIRAFGMMPVNMKPSRIHDYHSKMIRISGLIKQADRIAKYTALIKQRKTEEARDWEYTDGRYSIVMPGSAEEIIEEGRRLSHCVGTAGYIEAMAAKRCTILFLRDNKRITKPLITIEVRGGAIRQCYGERDTYNTDEHIRDFIQDYAAAHDLRIDAVIFSETNK